MLEHIYDFPYIMCMTTDAQTLFSAMANPIRLRCLLLLQLKGELCVCELTHALGLSQPMVSRHLALLRDASLVSDRREGQWIYYSIHPRVSNWAKTVLETTAKANSRQAPFNEDIRALREMTQRPAATCCA